MESSDEASEMACPMVLQAVWDDIQLLQSLPFDPFTYHVALASAVGARGRNSAINSRLVRMGFTSILLGETCF
jgi:hypothetical protein